MSTRSLTVFQDEQKREIAVMYRQMDGYPSGHGQELADFLKDKVVVNGIGMTDNRDIANGMDDLAAQIIFHFKSDSPVGGIYLHPAGTRNAGEEYIYIVRMNKDKILELVCKTDEVVLFEGLPRDFNGKEIEG